MGETQYMHQLMGSPDHIDPTPSFAHGSKNQHMRSRTLQKPKSNGAAATTPFLNILSDEKVVRILGGSRNKSEVCDSAVIGEDTLNNFPLVDVDTGTKLVWYPPIGPRSGTFSSTKFSTIPTIPSQLLSTALFLPRCHSKSSPHQAVPVLRVSQHVVQHAVGHLHVIRQRRYLGHAERNYQSKPFHAGDWSGDL